MATGDLALVDFITKIIPFANKSDKWVQSDLALLRIVGDLVDVLIEKV